MDEEQTFSSWEEVSAFLKSREHPLSLEFCQKVIDEVFTKACHVLMRQDHEAWLSEVPIDGEKVKSIWPGDLASLLPSRCNFFLVPPGSR